MRPGKKGCIAAAQPAILARMGVEAEAFIGMAATFLQEFGSAVGAPATLARLCERRQTRFLHGMQAARKVFHTDAIGCAAASTGRPLHDLRSLPLRPGKAA